MLLDSDKKDDEALLGSDSKEEMMTTAQAAKELGRHPVTLRKRRHEKGSTLTESGGIDSCGLPWQRKHGMAIVYKKSDVLKIIDDSI